MAQSTPGKPTKPQHADVGTKRSTGPGLDSVGYHSKHLADKYHDVPVPKVLFFPEYAIAQKLITRDEYDGIRSEYYAQSQLAAGLCLSLILLDLSFLVVRASVSGALAVGIGVVAFLSAVLGIDRLHKFHSVLQYLIAGRYRAALKAADDAKNAAAKPAAPTLQETLDKVSKELEQLREIVSNRPVVTINNTPPGPPK